MASVSSVSSNGGIYSASGTYDEVAILEKQKTALEKELQKVSQSKDDEKTKELKTKQIQLQIQQIEARIQQVKANRDKQNKSSVTEAVSDKTKDSNENTIDIKA